MSKEKISIVWFKKDLRINDNLALLSSSEANLPVLPLYIFETDYWSQDFASQRHWKFIHDCLIDLNKDLKKIGQSLIIRIGAANNILKILLKIMIFNLYLLTKKQEIVGPIKEIKISGFY